MIDDRKVQCEQEACQLWTTVYTTEGVPHAGCALELPPNMDKDSRFNI